MKLPCLSFKSKATSLFAARITCILSAVLLLATACSTNNLRKASAETIDETPRNSTTEPLMSSKKENKEENKEKLVGFYQALEQVLEKRGTRLEALYDREDAVSKRILEEYGAVFVATEKVLPPPACMFTSAAEVSEFQTKAGASSAEISGATIELQAAALMALLAAREEALGEGLNITPRDGAEAARRKYEDTLRLWDSRFLPALAHWQKLGKLAADEADRLAQLPIREQIKEVLELEKRGIFFSKDFSKSILYSVAAPGTSQHLSMLAFDAVEFQNPKVRKILARHGWFRTVKNDLPHFTYLGHEENLLPTLGLKKLKTNDGEFWVPNVQQTNEQL